MIEARVHVQAGVRHVVDDADGEMVLGPVLAQFVEHRLAHRRGEFLGRQPVAAADHPRQRRRGQGPGGLRFHQGIDDLQVHRLAGGARFLGALQSTAMDLTLAGSAARKWLADSGW